MSRYDTKEFGEAAPFLRKSDLELLSAQTVAFDGRPNTEGFKKRSFVGQITLNVLISEICFVFLFNINNINNSISVSNLVKLRRCCEMYYFCQCSFIC